MVVSAAVAMRAGRLDPAFFFFMQFIAAREDLPLNEGTFDHIMSRAKTAVEQARADARKLRDQANGLLAEARRIEALYPERMVRTGSQPW
jgi:preprotein translocase subunit SecA